MSESASSPTIIDLSNSSDGIGAVGSSPTRKASSARSFLVPALPAHAGPLAAKLRQQDRTELHYAAPGESLRELIEDGIRTSSPSAFTLMWEGHPGLIFGAAPSPTPGVGLAWMLGTDAVFSARRYVALWAPQWVRWLHHFYPRLENYVHDENTTSIAWLKRLGFQFAADPIDVNGAPFRLFWRDHDV